ncbi:MAG: PIN domain-containing protein [Acidimicrobiia bacterium]
MIALDASAVLAILRNESGAESVIRALHKHAAVMSTANLSEVLQKVAFFEQDPEIAERLLDAIGVIYVELTESLARLTAALYEVAPALSLADRTCFAIARIFGARAITFDHVWARYADAAGVDVELIRAA